MEEPAAVVHTTDTEDAEEPAAIIHTTNTEEPAAVVHTTDTKDTEEPAAVVHTTDTEGMKPAAVVHTTDAEDMEPVAVVHTTDTEEPAAVVHTTDTTDTEPAAVVHTANSPLGMNTEDLQDSLLIETPRDGDDVDVDDVVAQFSFSTDKDNSIVADVDRFCFEAHNRVVNDLWSQLDKANRRYRHKEKECTEKEKECTEGNLKFLSVMKSIKILSDGDKADIRRLEKDNQEANHQRDEANRQRDKANCSICKLEQHIAHLQSHNDDLQNALIQNFFTVTAPKFSGRGGEGAKQK